MDNPINVLICDDSILIRRKLKQVLDSVGGFNYFDASNGEEALKCVLNENIHLVLLDLVMPVMDGITFLEKIRLFNEDLKVLCISSFGTKEKLKEALDLGVVDFIQKPWQEEQLVKTITELKERL